MVILGNQGEKQDPERLRLEREELERRRKEGRNLRLNGWIVFIYD